MQDLRIAWWLDLGQELRARRFHSGFRLLFVAVVWMAWIAFLNGPRFVEGPDDYNGGAEGIAIAAWLLVALWFVELTLVLLGSKLAETRSRLELELGMRPTLPSGFKTHFWWNPVGTMALLGYLLLLAVVIMNARGN